MDHQIIILPSNRVYVVFSTAVQQVFCTGKTFDKRAGSYLLKHTLIFET